MLINKLKLLLNNFYILYFEKRLHALQGQALRKYSVYGFVIFTFLLCSVEFLAYKYRGPFSVIASRVWMIGWIYYLCLAIYYFLTSIITDIRKFELLSISVLFIVFCFIFYGMGNLQIVNFHFEATQQVVIGENNFKLTDWNYTNYGFLGYPSRQYLLVSIPSVLFGNSAFSLQLGYAIPFIAGVLVCYAGFREASVKRWNISPSFASLALLSIFTFPYVLEYVRLFEQIMLPLSFTLNAVGCFILLLNKLNLKRIFGFMFVSALLATSYTPALASWALSLVVTLLLIFAVRNNKVFFENSFNRMQTKFLISSAFLYMLMFGLCSFITRKDRSSKIGIDFSACLVNIRKAFSVFFFGVPVSFLGILSIVVILYIIISLTFKFGLFNFIISGWTLGVVAISVVLSGYAVLEPDKALYRALIVVPVIVYAMAWIIFKYLSRFEMKLELLYTTILVVLFTLISQNILLRPNQIFLYAKYSNPINLVISDILKQADIKGINKDKIGTIVMYTNDIYKTNFRDYTNYILPQVKIIVMKDNLSSVPKDIDTSKGVFVYCDNGIQMPSGIVSTGSDIEYIQLKSKYGSFPMTRLISSPKTGV